MACEYVYTIVINITVVSYKPNKTRQHHNNEQWHALNSKQAATTQYEYTEWVRYVREFLSESFFLSFFCLCHENKCILFASLIFIFLITGFLYWETDWLSMLRCVCVCVSHFHFIQYISFNKLCSHTQSHTQRVILSNLEQVHSTPHTYGLCWAFIAHSHTYSAQKMLHIFLFSVSLVARPLPSPSLFHLDIDTRSFSTCIPLCE